MTSGFSSVLQWSPPAVPSLIMGLWSRCGKINPCYWSWCITFFLAKPWQTLESRWRENHQSRAHLVQPAQFIDEKAETCDYWGHHLRSLASPVCLAFRIGSVCSFLGLAPAISHIRCALWGLHLTVICSPSFCFRSFLSALLFPYCRLGWPTHSMLWIM